MILCLYIAAIPFMVVIAAISAWLRIRRLRAGSVVDTLALIVGQNLPLAASLRAVAGSEGKAMREIFLRMAGRLERGDALATALQVALPACPGHILGTVRGAERGGTLPAVLRNLAARGSTDEQRPPSHSPSLLYSCVLLLVLVVTITFVCMQVVPKYVEIFLDFGAPLPGPLQTLVDLAKLMDQHLKLLLAALATALIGAAQLMYSRYFLARVPDRRQWQYALLDALAWHLPGVRQFVQSRALAQQLPVFHAAISAGQDVPPAARQAACVGVNIYARGRMQRLAELVEDGAPPADAAERAGLPGPVVAALRRGAQGGNVAAALEYVADYYRSLALHWRHIVAAVLAPGLVLFWAACVAFVVFSLMMPLMGLYEAVLAQVE